jgi:hypothetical protein
VAKKHGRLLSRGCSGGQHVAGLAVVSVA